MFADGAQAELKGDAAGYREGLENALASAEACGATGHAEQIRDEINAANSH